MRFVSDARLSRTAPLKTITHSVFSRRACGAAQYKLLMTHRQQLEPMPRQHEQRIDREAELERMRVGARRRVAADRADECAEERAAVAERRRRTRRPWTPQSCRVQDSRREAATNPERVLVDVSTNGSSLPAHGWTRSRPDFCRFVTSDAPPCYTGIRTP